MDRWGRRRLLFGEELGRSWGGPGRVQQPLALVIHCLSAGGGTLGGRAAPSGATSMYAYSEFQVQTPALSLLLGSPAASGERRPSHPSSESLGGTGREAASLGTSWGGASVGDPAGPSLAGVAPASTPVLPEAEPDLSSVLGLVQRVLHPRGFQRSCRTFTLKSELYQMVKSSGDSKNVCVAGGVIKSDLNQLVVGY